MKIGLHANDSKFPNLAIMKLSAFHKSKGDEVEFYMDGGKYDKIYSSKVFTWTNESVLPDHSLLGGTGYKLSNTLPDEIEHICPDYSLYGKDFSLGFLTRGCVRKCSFCVVPGKEGTTIPNADIHEFLRHKEVVLLDNNVLSHDHGIDQIKKISGLDVKIDFNQGMDARLVDKQIAKLLSKVKWKRFLRFACDHKSMIPHIKKTIDLLSNEGIKPYKIFVYFLVQDINESLERAETLRGMGIDIFAMPYRNFELNSNPSKILKIFARWVNHKAVFKSTPWEQYLDMSTQSPVEYSPAQLTF